MKLLDRKGMRALKCLTVLVFSLGTIAGQGSSPLVSVFEEDIARFTQLLTNTIPARRIEGVQGLSHYRHWPAERDLQRLLGDTSPEVRRQAWLALCRLGTSESVPSLIKALDDPSWEIRQDAWLALGRMTAQDLPNEKARWEQWWRSRNPAEHETALLEQVTQPAPGQSPFVRRKALRALLHLATTNAEPQLISWLTRGPQPPLDLDERGFVAGIFERVGTAQSLTTAGAWHHENAAWTLGRIGGTAAQHILVGAPKTLPVLLNLDRLGSTNAGPWVPFLVGNMGLVTYRGQPDDLMNPEPQPIQRVGAKLIQRAGMAPLLIELVLQELEDSMNPPLSHDPRPAAPAEWTQMLAAMREELKPGFVRNDGYTTSQPLTALYHLADTNIPAKRLLPLLHHPAFVPRIYVAMTLGKIHAPEALPALVALVREGYPFSDATALASGKHFDQSQTVRWRSFVCMAIGRLGGDAARAVLEEFAANVNQPRDIRYGAVVGLRFIGAPASVPVLRKVGQSDPIWMVREEARRVVQEIVASNPGQSS